MTKESDDYSGYQNHPRYGQRPRVTGLNPSDTPFNENVFLHWHSPTGIRIPNTAIAADTKRQLPATIPVTHYFDSKRVCRKCGTRFIFFAEEQKYWYETLQFPLEADMVECIACRAHNHKLASAREEYERLLATLGRSEEETLRLVECGIYLVEESIFSPKLLSKLRGFLNTLAADCESVVRPLRQRMAICERRQS